MKDKATEKDDTAKRLSRIQKQIQGLDARLDQLTNLVQASRLHDQPEPAHVCESASGTGQVERVLPRVTELTTTLRDEGAMGSWDARDAQIARVILEDLAILAADLRETANGAGEQLSTVLRDLRNIRHQLEETNGTAEA